MVSAGQAHTDSAYVWGTEQIDSTYQTFKIVAHVDKPHACGRRLILPHFIFARTQSQPRTTHHAPRTTHHAPRTTCRMAHARHTPSRAIMCVYGAWCMVWCTQGCTSCGCVAQTGSFPSAVHARSFTTSLRRRMVPSPWAMTTQSLARLTVCLTHSYHVYVYRACVRACVYVYMRACVRACVSARTIE